MSKHWKQPGRKSIAVRPSRIRRDPPPRMPTEAELQQVEAEKRERELWGGVTGVVIFALSIAVVAIAIGAVTYSRMDPAAAARDAARFRQCYNGGINCVLDGDTIYFERQKVDIAGIEAPAIQDAACGEEKLHGIDAAVRLADLLNSGTVTVGDPFSDQYGRAVRNVTVNGKDVGKSMLSARLAKEYIGEKRDWCAGAAKGS